MKHINFLRGATLALVAILSIGPAQAASITGFINFGGETVPTGGTNLGDATGLSFPTGFVVSNATDDLSGPTSGSINAFTFAAPAGPLLSFGTFSYSLSTLSVDDQSAQFLVLSGSGTLSGAGFDDTPYLFSMSVDTAGGDVAFSGTLANVPVPGALILFMSGLAALGIRKRD